MAIFAKRIKTHFLLSKVLEPVEIEMPPGVLVRRLTIEDIPLMKQVNPELIPELEKEKLGQELVGYLTFLEGVPAGYGFVQWKGKHSLQGTGRSLYLREKEILLLAAHTAEWARGKRLHSLMRQVSLYDFGQQGFRKANVLIDSTNEASLRSIQRLGFQVERKLRALLIRGWAIPLP